MNHPSPPITMHRTTLLSMLTTALVALWPAASIHGSDVLVYSVVRTGTSVSNEARATTLPTTNLTGLAQVNRVVSVKSYLVLDRAVQKDTDGVWRGNMAQVYYFTQPFGTGQMRAFNVVTGYYRMSSSTSEAADHEKPYEFVLNEGEGQSPTDPLSYEQLSVMWAYDGIGGPTSPFPDTFSKAGVGITDSRKYETNVPGLAENIYDVQSLHGMSALAYRFPVPKGSVPLIMFGIPTAMSGHWQTSSSYDWDRSTEMPPPPFVRSVSFTNQSGTQKATLNTKLSVEANPVTVVQTNGPDNIPGNSDDLLTLVRDGSIQLGLRAVIYNLQALGYVDVTPVN